MAAFILWFFFGVISAVAATTKGRNWFGWFLVGVLLGPIGVILSLVMPKNQKGIDREAQRSGDYRKCPQCAELVKREAVKCKHCGSELEWSEKSRLLREFPSQQDTTKMNAICSCGEKFSYPLRNLGRNIVCPSCHQVIIEAQQQ